MLLTITPTTGFVKTDAETALATKTILPCRPVLPAPEAPVGDGVPEAVQVVAVGIRSRRRVTSQPATRADIAELQNALELVDASVELLVMLATDFGGASGDASRTPRPAAPSGSSRAQ